MADNVRMCGSCTVCCKVPGIQDEQLSKPPNTWCQHCDNKSTKPCTIYENRPKTCQEFECLWLTEAGSKMPDDLRPDRSRVMFTALIVDIGVMPAGTIMAWEVQPGAFERPKVKRIIEAFKRKLPVLLMYQGGGRKVVGPPDVMAQISRNINLALANRQKRKESDVSDQGKAPE